MQPTPDLVLALLGTEALTAREISALCHGKQPGVTPALVRAALDKLVRRGLVYRLGGSCSGPVVYLLAEHYPQ